MGRKKCESRQAEVEGAQPRIDLRAMQLHQSSYSVYASFIQLGNECSGVFEIAKPVIIAKRLLAT